MLSNKYVLTRTSISFGILSITVLFGHALTFALSDFSPSSSSSNEAWFWFVFYHFLVNLPLIGAAYLSNNNKIARGNIQAPTFIDEALQPTISWLLIIALIGLGLHWDAKMRLLEEPFNGCWASLRGAWLNQVSRGTTIERIESILGHLLSSSVYLGLFLTSVRVISRPLVIRNLLYFGGFSLIGFMYALAIVSRSIMLVLLGIVILGCFYSFISSKFLFKSWAQRSFLLISLFGILSFGIAMSLFGNTVNCSAPIKLDGIKPSLKIKAQNYEDGFMDEIPIQRNENPTDAQKFTREACPLCNTVFMYLNHGMYNFIKVLDTDVRGPPVLLSFASNWARRLHLISSEQSLVLKRPYGNGGATLPGSAFHDFGGIGVVFTALAHGFLILCAVALVRRQGFGGLFGLALYVGCGLSIFISGMFVAPALIGFPFVIFSILILGGIFQMRRLVGQVRKRGKK